MNSIEKTSSDAITLNFSATAGPKLDRLPGGLNNSSKHDYLLFVYEDSYDLFGFGKDAQKWLYGEALQLIDGNGVKYRAIKGIRGLEIADFNSHAVAAILPYGTASHFNISFPIPQSPLKSLDFVSPDLHGHQDAWSLEIFNSK